MTSLRTAAVSPARVPPDGADAGRLAELSVTDLALIERVRVAFRDGLLERADRGRVGPVSIG